MWFGVSSPCLICISVSLVLFPVVPTSSNEELEAMEQCIGSLSCSAINHHHLGDPLQLNPTTVF